ncbi:hypothetical protein E1263_23330 [Kribbella antibiotica]|uniref:Uncharacterized protein n=1 Tax=Kribbella antibiotica TaxID=190195 RepID=A0A4R4ZHK7_9ACTN|nr:hypothetical protein [Kribbella antibiotica]TDD57526.1 hypothetical protein E1263_23330 [Kribbella antibiotica]
MTEMERRHRRVQRIVAGVYVGIPVVLLAIVALVSSRGPAAGWIVCAVPVAMLGLGLYLLPRHRYQPRWWPGVGGLFGAVAAVTAVVYPLVNGMWWVTALLLGVIAALPAAAFGLLVGILLARRANQVLLVPVMPELAESPYELMFLLRGLTRGTVLLGADTIEIRSTPTARGEHQSRSYPLSAITGTFEASLSGAERLKFPIAITVGGTPGPAVILQASGEDWVLPTNEAAILIELLDHRRTAKA